MFIVLYWKSRGVNISVERKGTFEEAKEFGDNMRRRFYDVIVVKELGDGKHIFYEFQNYGLYKVYKILNKALYLIFAIIIYYLYTQYS